jgi:hypothetical protein
LQETGHVPWKPTVTIAKLAGTNLIQRRIDKTAPRSTKSKLIVSLSLTTYSRIGPCSMLNRKQRQNQKKHRMWCSLRQKFPTPAGCRSLCTTLHNEDDVGFFHHVVKRKRISLQGARDRNAVFVGAHTLEGAHGPPSFAVLSGFIPDSMG